MDDNGQIEAELQRNSNWLACFSAKTTKQSLPKFYTI